MEPVLALYITFCLSAQCPNLGNFWAFVITVLLWSLMDMDAFGLGIIAVILTITLFTQSYKEVEEKES